MIRALVFVNFSTKNLRKISQTSGKASTSTDCGAFIVLTNIVFMNVTNETVLLLKSSLIQKVAMLPHAIQNFQ